jgi:hypothetical protein
MQGLVIRSGDGAQVNHAPPKNLITRLDHARANLDEGVALLAYALNLRELLFFGIDLDEMRDRIDELKREVAALKRRRPHG